jgi:uncharacterized protein YjbJ (UPF0337 family)
LSRKHSHELATKLILLSFLVCYARLASRECLASKHLLGTGCVVQYMNTEEIKAKGKQVEGKVREEVGKLTDNSSEQVKGGAQQTEGKIEETIAKVKKKI